MSDQSQPTTEQSIAEKYAPPLPKQVREQIAAAQEMFKPQEQAEQPEQEGQYVEGSDEPELPFEDQEEETWEQRARSTAGRLEQQTQANQQMARRLAELENQMSSMRLRGAEPPAPPTPPQRQRYVKEEEIQDYGEEFFDVVGRRAKEEVSPMFEEFQQRLKRLESGQQAVGQVMERSQKASVYETLKAEVPNYFEINHHPAFHQWLAFPDPFSGRQRHEMLKDAYARHEADRVVAFFKGFLSEATGLPQNTPSQERSAPPLPNGQAPNGNGSGRVSLEDFAAPGRARSAPQQVPPEKPVYTQASIAQFADDKRKGKFRGREAEALAIERDIFQAQHEGRLLP